MKNEREVFFLPECEEHIILLFNGELNIEDCKEEGCEGLKKCVVTAGEIEKFRKGGYAIGREKCWSVKDFPENKTPFIRVTNHPIHPRAIIISTYSWVDVVYHLKGKTIDERTGATRIEYDGTIKDAFTMYGTLVSFPNPPLIIHRAKKL